MGTRPLALILAVSAIWASSIALALPVVVNPLAGRRPGFVVVGDDGIQRTYYTPRNNNRRRPTTTRKPKAKTTTGNSTRNTQSTATRYTYFKTPPKQKPFKRYYDKFEDGRYFYTDPDTKTTLEWGYPCYSKVATSYQSPYSGYGRVPRYITPELVSGVMLPVTLEKKNGLHSRNRDKCEKLLSKIHDAWIAGDATSLGDLLSRNRKPAIYVRGEYAYSISKGEYCALTSDAMAEVSTVSFEFARKDWGRLNQACVVAEHIFTDNLGQRHTAYQSYLLVFESDAWRVVAFGTGSEDDAAIH